MKILGVMSHVQDYHERTGSTHNTFQAMVVSSELWSASTASMLKIKLPCLCDVDSLRGHDLKATVTDS